MEQLLLFPKVTPADILTAKLLLSEVRKGQRSIKVIEKSAKKTAEQVETLERHKIRESLLEMAIEAIADPITREIMRYRWLDPKGQSRKFTCIRFQLEETGLSERTIDRKISEGIELVAENLKLWGVLQDDARN